MNKTRRHTTPAPIFINLSKKQSLRHSVSTPIGNISKSPLAAEPDVPGRNALHNAEHDILDAFQFNYIFLLNFQSSDP